MILYVLSGMSAPIANSTLPPLPIPCNLMINSVCLMAIVLLLYGSNICIFGMHLGAFGGHWICTLIFKAVIIISSPIYYLRNFFLNTKSGSLAKNRQSMNSILAELIANVDQQIV